MFSTPKEAALQAENDRLKAENNWLRQHVEGVSGDTHVTPYGMQSEVALSAPSNAISLPLKASIRGARVIDRWEVIATYDRRAGDKLQVDYFVSEELRQHRDDWSFINEILPKMHDRFIRQLAEMFTRDHSR